MDWFLYDNGLRHERVKYQLHHTQFDQSSDHKHDIYLYGKLSTKLLAQAAVF